MMKAFEKHWKVVVPKIIAQHCIPNKGQYKAGWKAALEMIKRKIFEHRDALDIIEEELEQ